MNESDDRWKERTDERITSLTTSETVQNDRLDEIEEELHEFHVIIDGEPKDKDDEGLVGDVKRLYTDVQMLKNIMAPDALGNGGIKNRLSALERSDDRRTKSSEYRWKYWTAVTVAIVSLLGILLKDWPEISAYFDAPRKDAIGKKIEKVKHPKPRRVHYVIREEPEPSDQLHDSESQDEK